MHVHVEIDEEAGSWPQIADDDPRTVLMIPARFTVETANDCPRAQGDPFDWDVSIVVARNDDDAAHVVDEINIRRRPGGPPASAANVRNINIGSLLAEGIRYATVRADITAHNADGTFDITATARSAERLPAEIDIRRAVNKRRANEVTEADYDEALRLYELANSEGRQGALQWVADQIGVSRSAAHIRIKRAQEMKQ